MNKVDSTQRNTGSRWWWGPLLLAVLSALIMPLAGTILGAFFTGWLAVRKAPRRDIAAMAIATVVAALFFWAATEGYLTSYDGFYNSRPEE